MRNIEPDLHAFLHDVLNITDKQIHYSIMTQAKVLLYSNRDTILSPDDSFSDYLILIKGKAREFLIDENGHDITFSFLYDPGEFLVNSNEYIRSGSFYWEAIGRTWIMQIDKKIIDKAIRSDSGFHNLITQYIQNVYSEKSELHFAQKTMQAKERYQWFLNYYKDFPEEIPQKYIASYLNMLPQTLSEVRSKLRTNENKRILAD